MKSNIKKLLVIFMLIISYIIINLICENTAFAVTQTISTDINAIDSNQYPQIKEMLQNLKAEHPNWNFKILYTDITWAEAISNEYVGHGNSPRNLVPANNSNYNGAWICSACGSKVYDSGSWCCASESAIGYMMDARNSLNNSDIFQFLELSYSECNIDAIKSMVKDTFLNNDTYVNAIIQAAQTHNVNAHYIVARILQEQGSDGSTLSKGQGYNGQFIGVYNVFNIGASGNGKDNVILNGLARAEKEGWTTLESSIIGGTQIIAKSYIARGQNTLYLQKFDVDNSDGELYWHQYMQNLLAAQKEGTTLRKKFEEMKSIEGAYTFIIPVFENMPNTAVPRPSTTSSTPSINVDLVRVNVNGSLFLRREPRKDSEKIGSVYKDDIITRLEKATEKVDGTYWDYVMKSNGTKGYAARETFDYESTYKLYLVPVNPEPSEPDDSAILKNDKVKIDTKNNSVITVPNATVKDFSDLIGASVVAKNANGEILSADAKLSTGCVINGIYTIAVLGDVNGDGSITAGDYVNIKKHIMGNGNINENNKLGADVNQDGKITAGDYVIVKNYIMGKIIIEL